MAKNFLKTIPQTYANNKENGSGNWEGINPAKKSGILKRGIYAMPSRADSDRAFTCPSTAQTSLQHDT